MTQDTEVPANWKPDWPAIADHIVNRTLQIQRGERVIYMIDAWLYADLLDCVRAAVLNVGGIEQATILTWTKRLRELRTPRGTSPDPELVQLEQRAHLDLFQTADVFMWLPNDFTVRGTYTGWETEWILDRWRGRGIHCHWFPDPLAPAGDGVHRKLEYIYQRAILELDYAALKKRQQQLLAAIRGRTLRVTTPEGTDITFSLPADGWYHCNDGELSRERALRAVCARDREEEVPCGAVRTVPAPDSANGVIALRKTVAWNGFPFDVNEYVPLDIVFKDGRITELKSSKDNAKLNQIYTSLTGDKDRLGEIVIGTNPLLETPRGASMPTYWGFGDGAFRFHLGDNIESAGKYRSNLWINLFLSDVTVTCGSDILVKDGKLT